VRFRGVFGGAFFPYSGFVLGCAECQQALWDVFILSANQDAFHHTAGLFALPHSNKYSFKPNIFSVSGGDNAYVRPQPPAPKSNGGTKTFFNKYSPKKPKTSAQASPQKQSTLTNFFCPVNKKR